MHHLKPDDMDSCMNLQVQLPYRVKRETLWLNWQLEISIFVLNVIQAIMFFSALTIFCVQKGHFNVSLPLGESSSSGESEFHRLWLNCGSKAQSITEKHPQSIRGSSFGNHEPQMGGRCSHMLIFVYIKAVSLKTLSWNSKTCCLISLQFINEQQVRGTAKQNQRSGRSSKHIDHWWPQTVRQTQNFVLVQEKGGSKFRAKIRPNLYTVNHPLGIMIIIFLFNLEGNKRLYRSCQNKSWNGRRRELCVLKLTLSVPVLLMYRLIVGATDSVCCLCSSQMQSAQ